MATLNAEALQAWHRLLEDAGVHPAAGDTVTVELDNGDRVEVKGRKVTSV